MDVIKNIHYKYNDNLKTENGKNILQKIMNQKAQCYENKKKRSKRQKSIDSATNEYTIQPVYSGHAIWGTPGYSGRFSFEPAQSWSNCYKKTDTYMQQTLLK